MCPHRREPVRLSNAGGRHNNTELTATKTTAEDVLAVKDLETRWARVAVDLHEAGFGVLKKVVTSCVCHADGNSLLHQVNDRLKLIGCDHLDRFLERFAESLPLAEIKRLLFHVTHIARVRVRSHTMQEIYDLVLQDHVRALLQILLDDRHQELHCRKALVLLVVFEIAIGQEREVLQIEVIRLHDFNHLGCPDAVCQ